MVGLLIWVRVRKIPSAHKSLKPFSELGEFKLARRFRAIEGIADDNVTQFGRSIDVTVHPVEQVEKSFQVIVGVSCWTRTEGLEQALAFCRCQPVRIFHLVPMHVLKATQPTGNRTATCASAWVDWSNPPPSLYWLQTYSLQDAGFGSRLTA